MHGIDGNANGMEDTREKLTECGPRGKYVCNVCVKENLKDVEYFIYTYRHIIHNRTLKTFAFIHRVKRLQTKTMSLKMLFIYEFINNVKIIIQIVLGT